MASVFTYGTLQTQEVMRLVTGKEFNSIPATLSGYQRFKFKDKSYPGVIENSRCTIEGTLYTGIDSNALALLDAFEDIAYDRCLLDVTISEDQTEKAFVYTVKDEYKKYLSDEEWNKEEFEKSDLEKYIEAISSF